jgi:hypothetical protein
MIYDVAFVTGVHEKLIVFESHVPWVAVSTVVGAGGISTIGGRSVTVICCVHSAPKEVLVVPLCGCHAKVYVPGIDGAVKFDFV